MPRKIRPLLERLMEKVRVTDAGCWEWTGCTNYKGYGCIWVGGEIGRNVRVHRAMYELRVGPIPPDLQIDHLCRNRRCVNPEHLEPVTSRQNTLRGESLPAKNSVKTLCKFGHQLSGYNLMVRKTGGRRCRTCHTADKRAARARARTGAK